MISAVSSFVMDMLRFILKYEGEKCGNGKQFFSIIENLSGRIQSKCKTGYNRGIHRNDSTIRLNKQRKVFNYSAEIFIRNFSHYFTLLFGSKFFRCLRKLAKSGRRRHGKTALFYSN